jgi:hypothetical protein
MTKKVPLAGVQKLIILAGNKLKELSIPGYFNSTDTMNILTYIPKSLETLEVRNINLDYRNIWTKGIFGDNFRRIILVNENFKTKKFDIKDMEALGTGIKMTRELKIVNSPVTDEIIDIFLQRMTCLKKIS